MVANVTINILKSIETIQKIIFVLLFIIIGLGGISLIINIIRLAIIRMVSSMVLVVSAMIINIISKFLVLELIVYHLGINTLIAGIVILLMQIVITILLLILVFKRKKDKKLSKK